MVGFDLEGRLAVITGAGSGIGRAIGLATARLGMTVALADTDENAARETLKAVEQIGGHGLAARVDIRDAGMLTAFAAAAIERFDVPALMFANAGILRYESSLRPNLENWRRAVDVNLIGTINTVAAFLGRMIDGGKDGQFVITGSQGSFVAAPELASYVATKHAVHALAQCLRMELGDDARIGVSLLAPPRVDTPILDESVARTRATRGENAAAALRSSAMTPAQIAVCAIQGAKERRFYIAPQIDDVAPIIRQRIDELLGG